jgi:hypothetical protein
MSKKLSLSTYIRDELSIVYPTFPVFENVTLRLKVWVFIKQDCIAYFAPLRLMLRAIKSVILTLFKN